MLCGILASDAGRALSHRHIGRCHTRYLRRIGELGNVHLVKLTKARHFNPLNPLQKIRALY
jgi:hypothetical protein